MFFAKKRKEVKSSASLCMVLGRALTATLIMFVAGIVPAAADTVTVGPECVTVPPLPGGKLACLFNSTLGLDTCIKVPPTPGCTVCASLTCSATGSIAVTPGAPKYEPPKCALAATIDTTGLGACTASLTSTCATLPPLPVVPLLPIGDETQVCLIQGILP